MRNSIREEMIGKAIDLLKSRNIGILKIEDEDIDIGGGAFNYGYTITTIYLDLEDEECEEVGVEIHQLLREERLKEYPGVKFYEIEYDEKSDIEFQPRSIYSLNEEKEGKDGSKS